MSDKYVNFLKEKISDSSGIEIEKISSNINIFSNNYVDSIAIFTLFVEIEDRFNIEISVEDLENLDISTIEGLAKAIENAEQNN